jgi:hypothetical protein
MDELSRKFSLPEGHFLLNSQNHSPNGRWVRIISIKLESADKTLTDVDNHFFNKIGFVYLFVDMRLPNGDNIEYIPVDDQKLINRKITEKSNYNILHYIPVDK